MPMVRKNDGYPRMLTGHTADVTSLAWTVNGDVLVSGSFDGTIRTWDPETGKKLQTLTGHDGWVTAIATIPGSGQMVSVGSDRSIRVWDPYSGHQLRVFSSAHSNDIWALAVAPDGKTMVSGGHDHILKIRDLATGVVLQEFRKHTNSALCAAFSPNGRRFVSGGDDGTVRVWEASTGREVTQLESHGAPVRALVWMRSGTIVSASIDRTIRIHNKPSNVLRGHTDEVGALAVTADQRLPASASFDGTVRIWDSEPGDQLKVLPESCQSFPVGLAFHPRTQILALVDAGNVIKLVDPGVKLSPMPIPEASIPRFKYAAYLSCDRAADLPVERIKEALSAELQKLDVPGAVFMNPPFDIDKDEARPSLSESACFIPVLTRKYFTSAACAREYAEMEKLENERLAGWEDAKQSRSWILPVVLWEDMKDLPTLVVHRQVFSFARFSLTRERDPSGEFQLVMGQLAHAIAERWAELVTPLTIEEENPAEVVSDPREEQNIEIPEDLVKRTMDGRNGLVHRIGIKLFSAATGPAAFVVRNAQMGLATSA